MEVGRSSNQEDPRRRIILAPYVFCIQFTCKRSYLALVLGSSQLTARKILELGRSSHHVNCLRSEVPRARDKKTNVAAAGFAQYSAAKGRQFRLALPQDDSNDSDDRRQYSGQVLFQRYTAQTRDTVESNEQSIDNNVENGSSRIHPNLSEYIRITKRKVISSCWIFLVLGSCYLHVNSP